MNNSNCSLFATSLRCFGTASFTLDLCLLDLIGDIGHMIVCLSLNWMSVTLKNQVPGGEH